VKEVTASKDDAAIVRAVITMGKSLEQRVIAEGVETREQTAFLTVNGCDEAQGNYFSPPLPPQQFAELLGSNASLVARV
jgi:EAL domain-containing protein (putative c-di-GMP-specific phosphodiesterase class I)